MSTLKLYAISDKSLMKYFMRLITIVLKNECLFLVDIDTRSSTEYRYVPVTKSRLRLGIRAAHDARVSLRTHLGADSNAYEVRM